MRTSFFFLAAALAAVGCGDDTGGSGGAGTGSGGGSSTATGDTTGTGATTGSSGDGGGASTTTTTGSSGDGGGSTTTGAGGFEPAETVQEACENFNEVLTSISSELGCEAGLGNCTAPVESCEPELLALLNCLVAQTSADDCTCVGGGEGGGDSGGDLDCEGVAGGDCPDENEAYVSCAGL